MSPKQDPGLDSEILDKPERKIKEPPRYRVLMHNDDYTTQDFVVLILMLVFNKPIPEATRIMLNIHRKGTGICGVFTAEIAESKIQRVHAEAQAAGFPLRCSMERE